VDTQYPHKQYRYGYSFQEMKGGEKINISLSSVCVLKWRPCRMKKISFRYISLVFLRSWWLIIIIIRRRHRRHHRDWSTQVYKNC